MYTVIVGRFTADTGYFMVLPFLTVYVSQLGMSGLEAGALFAILQAMRLGFGVPAGWASDRFGPSVVLVAGLLLEAAGYVQFLLAGGSFPAWAAAVAVLGLGGAFNSNGSRSLLTVIAGQASAAALNLSRHYIAINAAGLIGPLIGTALIAAHEAKAGFAIAAALHVLFAAATIPLLRYMRRGAAGQPAAPSVSAAIRDTILLRYCAIAVCGWFLVSQYRIALSLSIVHQSIAISTIGLLTALNAVMVMLTVALTVKRVTRLAMRGRINVLAISGLALGLGWMCCAVGGLAALVVSVLITSIGEALFVGVVDAIVVMFAPRGNSGQYLGYSSTAWGLGAVLAGFSGGLFDVAASHHALFGFWLALCFIGVAVAAGARLGRQSFASTADQRQPIPVATADGLT